MLSIYEVLQNAGANLKSTYDLVVQIGLSQLDNVLFAIEKGYALDDEIDWDNIDTLTEKKDVQN
jgi:hypothetical protein